MYNAFEGIERYFTMSYLLKYGYFDFKFSTKKSIDDDYLVSQTIYKKVFNSKALWNEFQYINSVISFDSKSETAPMELSIYKNEDERRLYKLPNIYSYIALCQHLVKYKDMYIDILNLSDNSLSNEFYNKPFHYGRNRRESNRIGKKHLFLTDIQHFYPSIYTHSIPWVLVGKEEAKSNRNNYNVYYNELDKLIQKSQRGETSGIPTGTFASRIIAEIYMCKLDEKLKKHSYLRYVDDFELPYNDDSEKVDFYNDLNKELSALNLKIKVEKNITDTFPFQGDNNSQFFFDYFSNEDKVSTNQKQRIHSFIDSSIYKEREGYKGSLKLMFKALTDAVKKSILSKKSFTIPISNKLFNFVLMSPHLSVYYLEFIDSLTKETIDTIIIRGIVRIKDKIGLIMNSYIDLNHHQEAYSLLSIFYHLELNVITPNRLLKIIREMDELSSILAFELYITQARVDDSLFKAIESKLEYSKSWIEEYWFFKYHILYRINKPKRSKINKAYKNYLYDTYGNRIEKGKFFNKSYLKYVPSSLNLEYQNHNTGESDIRNFFSLLFKKQVLFFELK